jgi:hypothetical protein
MLNYLTLHSDPINPLHATTKSYVDNLVNGLSWKYSVRLSTAAALPAYSFSSNIITGNSTGQLTIDGVNVNTNDRVLIKNESGANQKYNGIYVVTSPGNISTRYILTRSEDTNSASELSSATVYIREGSTEISRIYTCNTNNIILNTTPITFALFSGGGGGSYTNGAGLDLISTTFSVATNGIINSMLRQSAAVSVIGRSANTTGDVDDIVASQNDQFLVRRSNQLVFDFLSTIEITNALGYTPFDTATTLGGDLSGNLPNPTVAWANGLSTYDLYYAVLGNYAVLNTDVDFSKVTITNTNTTDGVLIIPKHSNLISYTQDGLHVTSDANQNMVLFNKFEFYLTLDITTQLTRARTQIFEDRDGTIALQE